MGVDLGELFNRTGIGLDDVCGRWVAVDAFNTLYQFLSIIRQQDGTPLMDLSGRVTSHLSGILYRITNLVEAGARIAFVFDGEPPGEKRRVLAGRSEVREKAETLWEEARAAGEDGFRYAQAASRINAEILADSFRLLSSMGIPTVQAPSEGEAQAAFMAMRGDVYYAASQDYDALLFGSPRVVRNLTVTGKRKLPKKNVYVDVTPEVIGLDDELMRLGIDRKQLVEVGILCGTDYNEGLDRVGPKTALKLIREHGNLESVFSARGETIDGYDRVRDLFLHPQVTEDYRLCSARPKVDEIVSFLCGERDFSEERVMKAATRLEEAYNAGQSTLDRWL